MYCTRTYCTGICISPGGVQYKMASLVGQIANPVPIHTCTGTNTTPIPVPVPATSASASASAVAADARELSAEATAGTKTGKAKDTGKQQQQQQQGEETGPYRSYEGFAIQAPPLSACKLALGAVDMSVAFKDANSTFGDDDNNNNGDGTCCKGDYATERGENAEDGQQSIPELAAQAEAQFNRDGFVILKNLVSREWADQAREEALGNWRSAMDLVNKADAELGLGAKNGFAEILFRNEGRYEVMMGMEEGSFALGNETCTQNPFLVQVIKRIIREPCKVFKSSLILAMPGAGEQHWHADGIHVNKSKHLPCHILNVCIPLVDLTPDHGPTELRPGSHFFTRKLFKMMLRAKARGEWQAPMKPCLRMGDALLFDHRILHRGPSNDHKTAMRPMLCITYCQQRFTDLVNYPKRSLRAMVAGMTEKSAAEQSEQSGAKGQGKGE